MAKVDFTKMHGIGNDFVMLDCRRKRITNLAKKAELICDRHFGVGCDQIIVILPSKKADYRMQIFNADGSEVEMCGNGIRCFAKYLWDRKEKIIRKTKRLSVETMGGIIRPKIAGKDMVEVDMGPPYLDGADIPTTFTGEVIDRRISVGKNKYNITAVSMGNPHCVIFTDDVDTIDLEREGRALETHKAFPNRTNVEFVQVINKSRIKVRVWERGSGATLACGTGACAAAVAAHLNERTGRKVTVELPGGALAIDWTKSGPVLMTGPAEEVFSGIMYI